MFVLGHEPKGRNEHVTRTAYGVVDATEVVAIHQSFQADAFGFMAGVFGA